MSQCPDLRPPVAPLQLLSGQKKVVVIDNKSVNVGYWSTPPQYLSSSVSSDSEDRIQNHSISFWIFKCSASVLAGTNIPRCIFPSIALSMWLQEKGVFRVDWSESDSVYEVLFAKKYWQKINILINDWWHILLYNTIISSFCATDTVHQTWAARFKSITGTSCTHSEQNKKHAYLIYT